jgi:hypothetical protein
MSTPYVRSIVQVVSRGTDQDVGRSALYTYVNPDNTAAEVVASGFFSGVSKFDLMADDLMYATMSDDTVMLQFTSSDTAVVVLS